MAKFKWFQDETGKSVLLNLDLVIQVRFDDETLSDRTIAHFDTVEDLAITFVFPSVQEAVDAIRD